MNSSTIECPKPSSNVLGLLFIVDVVLALTIVQSVFTVVRSDVWQSQYNG